MTSPDLVLLSQAARLDAVLARWPALPWAVVCELAALKPRSEQ